MRALILALTALVASTAANAAASFDTPLKTEIIATGPKTKLNCLTYPHFLLKWESSDYSSEIYILRGKGPWKCAATMMGELTFNSWGVVRVKGRYIILGSKPNTKWRAPFKVFDTRIWRYVLEDALLGDFTDVRLDKDGIALEYRRVHDTGCSVFFGAATECWGKVRAQTGLADDAWGICRQGYHDSIIKARGELHDPRALSATLTYSAVVRLGKGAPAFTARPGAVECSP